MKQRLQKLSFGFLLAQTVASNEIEVNKRELGFQIPTLSTVLTFAIRTIFVIGGLLALVYLLLGAIAWITSGGDKDAVDKARNKIQAAVVGVILIAVVLALVVTLEQIVFQRAICFGLSCPITIPALLQPCNERHPCSIIITPTPIISPTVTPTPTTTPSATLTPVVVTLAPLPTILDPPSY